MDRGATRRAKQKRHRAARPGGRPIYVGLPGGRSSSNVGLCHKREHVGPGSAAGPLAGPPRSNDSFCVLAKQSPATLSARTLIGMVDPGLRRHQRAGEALFDHHDGAEDLLCRADRAHSGCRSSKRDNPGACGRRSTPGHCPPAAPKNGRTEHGPRSLVESGARRVR